MRKKLALIIIANLILGSATFAEIEIVHPIASPSTGPNAAIYMKIVNHSKEPDQLISVQANEATRSEVHNHILREDGSHHMTVVGFIEIPGRGSQMLEPGGYHVMLQNIYKPLRSGEVVHLILEFKNAGVIKVNAPVQAFSRS